MACPGKINLGMPEMREQLAGLGKGMKAGFHDEAGG